MGLSCWPASLCSLQESTTVYSPVMDWWIWLPVWGWSITECTQNITCHARKAWLGTLVDPCCLSASTYTPFLQVHSGIPATFPFEYTTAWLHPNYSIPAFSIFFPPSVLLFLFQLHPSLIPYFSFHFIITFLLFHLPYFSSILQFVLSVFLPFPCDHRWAPLLLRVTVTSLLSQR